LKKSGSIEAQDWIQLIGRLFLFSALKKSGSIEAGQRPFSTPYFYGIFRFEKKRLH